MATRSIREFYLSPYNGDMTYEYSDDITRKFNLDDIILTDTEGKQVFDKAHFDTTLDDPEYKEGLLFYDKIDHCLSYYNDDPNVKVSLSREQLIRVYNATGSILHNGEVAYVNGAYSGFPTIALAASTTLLSSQSTVGLVTGDIAVGAFGYICNQGTVHGINTNAYTPGTLLFLSAVPGELTDIPAVQPNFNVEIGTALTQSATDGNIFVRIDKKSWLPSISLVDDTISILVPTVPTILKPLTISSNNGFEYDSSTGEITITENKTYVINMQFNLSNGNSTKVLYFYIEELIDSVWTPVKYSARSIYLSNVESVQYLISYSRYYVKGMKIRLYYWSNSTTVNIVTADVPGTPPGTLVIPAFKLNMA